MVRDSLTHLSFFVISFNISVRQLCNVKRVRFLGRQLCNETLYNEYRPAPRAGGGVGSPGNSWRGCAARYSKS